MTPGPFQILLILVLVLFLFGAGRVPAIAENLAKGIKSFKRGLRDDDDTKAIEKQEDKTESS
jgi:sec-independent protein translocase protein TatA